jgi:hypothetical protein
MKLALSHGMVIAVAVGGWTGGQVGVATTGGLVGITGIDEVDVGKVGMRGGVLVTTADWVN